MIDDHEIFRTFLSQDEMLQVFRLRLAIARAGHKDALGWTQDEPLTEDAQFVLSRPFTQSALLAGESIALAGALARHRSLLKGRMPLVHLFALDLAGRDRLAEWKMRTSALGGHRPVTSMDALRVVLGEITGKPVQYERYRATDERLIRIRPAGEPELPPALRAARALAWAYLEGAPGNLVYPFIKEEGA